MQLQIVELAIFDFDGTLLRSPKPPGATFTWWLHAYSLDDVKKGPGLDPRWVLPVVAAARHASLRGGTATVLLTARPLHRGMRRAIRRVLKLTGIDFDVVQLKPITVLRSDAHYKAAVVQAWLQKLPSVRSVTFYDDLQDNLDAVGDVVRARGIAYRPVLGPGL